MPPSRKPRKETVAKAQAGIMDFLKFAGVDVDEAKVQETFDASIYTPREPDDVPMLQAEGVLLYAQNAARNFMPKKCKRCKSAFSTNYVSVAYCSSLCRGKAMEETLGVKWDYTKDHYELIGVERPLVVGPEAYSLLLEMAQRILDNHHILMEAPVIESPLPLMADSPDYPEETKYPDVPDTNPAPLPQQQDQVSLMAQLPPAPF